LILRGLATGVRGAQIRAHCRVRGRLHRASAFVVLARPGSSFASFYLFPPGCSRSAPGPSFLGTRGWSSIAGALFRTEARKDVHYVRLGAPPSAVQPRRLQVRWPRAAFPRMYGLEVTAGRRSGKRRNGALFGGSCERVARSVEAETKWPMVAVMAPIRANEENPAKERTPGAFSSRSMDRGASTAGDTADDVNRSGQIHGLAFRGKIS